MAMPVEEPEKQERSKPIAEAYDFSSPDIFEVDGKDPNFYYYHARNDPLNLQKWKKRGFEVVSGVNAGDEQAVSPANVDNNADSGFINMPGHILMRCPKNVNDARITRNRQNFEEIRRRDKERDAKMSRMLKRMGSRVGLKFEERDGYQED